MNPFTEFQDITLLWTTAKFLNCPLSSISEIKDEQKTEFLNKSILFNPRYIIPFASDHYYRAAESLEQNKSLININELSSLDLRIIPMKVGEAIKFDGQLNIRLVAAA